MMNQIKLSCFFLCLTMTLMAQETDPITPLPKWEVVALGTPVFNSGNSNEDQKGARLSLQVGKVVNKNLSLGLRPSYEFHGHRAIRGALQVYAKYRKWFNSKANWFVQSELGYGFEELYSTRVFSPGIGQERIITRNHEGMYWQTRLDMGLGLEFYLFEGIQGLLVLNTGQGIEMGLRKTF